MISQKPTHQGKSPTPHHLPARAIGVLVILSTCVLSSQLYGEGPNGEEEEAAITSIEVRSASISCEECHPREAVLELEFDRDVDPNAVALLSVTSPPVTLLPENRYPSRTVRLTGRLRRLTDYVLRLPAGSDVGTGRTSNPIEYAFQTGGARPHVRLPVGETMLSQGRLPVVLRETASARVRVLPIEAEELADARSLAGVHYDGTDPIERLPDTMKARVREQELRAPNNRGSVHRGVDVFGLAGGDPVLVVVDAPGARAVATIVQKADLAVSMKTAATGGLVWVVDTVTGEPVANAAVSVQVGYDVRFRGRSNGSGLVTLPGTDDLRREGEEPWSFPLVATVQKGDRFAYASEQFSTGIQSWQFGVPYSYGGSEAFRGMVTAERGIYRPGEKVHLFGVLRKRQPDGSLQPPRVPVEVAVTAPDGTVLSTRSLRPTSFGTFRSEVEIPAGSRLGRYHVTATPRGGRALRHAFEVGEFRANTFEVEVPPAESASFDGDELTLPIRANYLYGAPVAGGEVRYDVQYRGREIRAVGHSGFRFQREGNGYTRYLTRGELTLDDSGAGQIVIRRSEIPTSAATPQMIDLIVEATVTDAADDTVTGRTVQTLSTVDTMVGVKNDRWIAGAGDRWTVELLAIDAEGHPVSGRPMEVSLHRRVWRSTAEEGAHGVRYDGYWDEETVSTQRITSRTGPTPARFELTEGGSYWVEAKADGQASASRASIWVYGGENYGPMHNHPRLELMLDQDSYAPGDTVQAFAMSPYEQSTALVTVERNGVLEARTMELQGSETPIEVRVGRNHLPNAFLGVMIVPRGRGTASPASGVPLRMGYAELHVSPAERRLQVEVEPVSGALEPGDTADVRVRVRDHRGRPVRSEVTLWAADEGVLQLTGYRTPDPFRPAYAEEPLSINNASNLTRWTSNDEGQWEDEGGDSGGGQAETAALRSRFLSTAFFSRGVVTNAQGVARVRVPLPDNLTRWRVMAAVADRGARFGSGDAGITASKPLQLTPSFPRFLTEGDQVDASVVVHNHTGQRGDVRVELQVEGAELQGPAAQTIAVADGAQGVVRFDVRASELGEVRFRARASLAGEEDGFELSIPIHTATAWQNELAA
ncbi:MAG: MG2 domain-containing protein, partial [Myxococcota bacterium]